MDLTQVDVEPSEASEVGMEPSEATSKESYFASQAKSAESKEWAKELVRDGDRKARALKRSATFRRATYVHPRTVVVVHALSSNFSRVEV